MQSRGFGPSRIYIKANLSCVQMVQIQDVATGNSQYEWRPPHAWPQLHSGTRRRCAHAAKAFPCGHTSRQSTVGLCVATGFDAGKFWRANFLALKPVATREALCNSASKPGSTGPWGDSCISQCAVSSTKGFSTRTFAPMSQGFSPKKDSSRRSLSGIFCLKSSFFSSCWKHWTTFQLWPKHFVCILTCISTRKLFLVLCKPFWGEVFCTCNTMATSLWIFMAISKPKCPHTCYKVAKAMM